MQQIHINCQGCGFVINEGDKDIIIIEKGKIEFDQGNIFIGDDNEQVWIGHEDCYYKDIKPEHIDIDGRD